jgi:hypothetical protein
MSGGYKDFTAGAVLTAADLEQYCELQGIMKFASAAARNTALSGVLEEGLPAFLLDSNTLTVYSGAAWSTVGPLFGALTDWTPAVTQTGSVTVTNTYSKYIRIGRLVAGWFTLAVTGSGSGSAAITISVPVTAASTAPLVGRCRFYDQSGPNTTDAWLYMASTTTFGGTTSVGTVLGSLFNLANLDTITGFFFYEAAGDA